VKTLFDTAVTGEKETFAIVSAIATQKYSFLRSITAKSLPSTT
jgi:hypothetical protein